MAELDACDIAVVCALHSPELSALLETGSRGNPLTIPGDPRTYHRLTYTTKAGHELRIVAAASQMGLAAAGVLATKMILTFRPKLVAMVGIAAGADPDKQGFGDILAATHTYDYGSGKLTESGLHPDPQPLEVASGIVDRLRVWQSHGGLAAIRNAWTGARPSSALRLHVGPLGSGDAVLGVREPIEEAKKHWRKLIGIEMEAFAVHKSACDTVKPAPAFLCLKSICDFAAEKTDSWQDYAAYTAAALFHQFIVEDWEKLELGECGSPTRGILRDAGHFPGFMDEIIAAINTAVDDSEILIACDYAGYGAFSAPERYDLYVAALVEARKRRCTIRSIVSGRAALEVARDSSARHRAEESYVAGRTQPPFPKLLVQLAKKLGDAAPTGDPSTWSYDVFLDAMRELEHSCEATFAELGELAQTPPLPIYLWLTESRAVWAIPPYQIPERLHAKEMAAAVRTDSSPDKLSFAERAFVSSSREGLGQQLRHVWKHYWRSARPVQDEPELRRPAPRKPTVGRPARGRVTDCELVDLGIAICEAVSRDLSERTEYKMRALPTPGAAPGNERLQIDEICAITADRIAHDWAIRTGARVLVVGEDRDVDVDDGLDVVVHLDALDGTQHWVRSKNLYCTAMSIFASGLDGATGAYSLRCSLVMDADRRLFVAREDSQTSSFVAGPGGTFVAMKARPDRVKPLAAAHVCTVARRDAQFAVLAKQLSTPLPFSGLYTFGGNPILAAHALGEYDAYDAVFQFPREARNDKLRTWDCLPGLHIAWRAGCAVVTPKQQPLDVMALSATALQRSSDEAVAFVVSASPQLAGDLATWMDGGMPRQ